MQAQQAAGGADAGAAGAGAGQQAGGADSRAQQDDVVDADFKEVKDNK
jgi:molecular chaperone DnaK